MKIKYVGAKPIVSQHGVSFDQSKQDAYTFIAPAVELLDSLERIAADEKGVVDLREWQAKGYSEQALADRLIHYCPDLDTLASEREKKVNELIAELTRKVEESSRLTGDERKAWLGNIALMKAYYKQYVTNELAYDCLLDRLADDLTQEHIRVILFPIYRNYGLVFSHLVPVLTDHRPPIDASITFDEKGGSVYGRFDSNKPLPSKKII